jgi:hypothetical protein
VSRSTAFVARSVVSKGRTARRADEKSRGGLKKRKSYRDDLAPQQAVRTITIEKAFYFWHRHHGTRLKRTDESYIRCRPCSKAAYGRERKW